MSEQEGFRLALLPVQLRRTQKKKRATFNEGTKVICRIVRGSSLSNAEGETVDQSRDDQERVFIQDRLKINCKALYFTVSHSQESQWWVKVMVGQPSRGSIDGGRVVHRGQRPQGVLKEVGSFLIDPSIYVDVFQQARKSFFQQNAELNRHFSLDYEVFIDRSADGLKQTMNKWRGGEGLNFAAAFKKSEGRRRVRYVEVLENGQRSIKEEEFHKNHQKPLEKIKKKALTKVDPQSKPRKNSTKLHLQLSPQPKRTKTSRQKVSSEGNEAVPILSPKAVEVVPAIKPPDSKWSRYSRTGMQILLTVVSLALLVIFMQPSRRI